MSTTPTLTAVAETLVATSSARRRCTEVVQIIEGLVIDICTAGQSAALHISTRKGRVVVRLTADELFAKIRAGRDANGTPFPEPSASTLELLEKDAASTAPKMDEAAPAPRQRCIRRTSQAVAAGMAAAWQQLRAGSREPIAVIATGHGIGADKLYPWLKANHGPEWAMIMRYRRGKASQDDLAALGFPLTKPSGQL